MKLVESFSDILKETRYDTIACDIYGVIHDGIKAYPHSKSALTSLKHNGEHVVLLSNSTRLQDRLVSNMQSNFDISSTSFDKILSSGTLTKIFLRDMAECLEIGQVKQPGCHATARKQGQSTRMEPDVFARTYLKTGKFFLAGDTEWQEPLYLSLAPTLTRVYDWEEIEFVLLGSIHGVDPVNKPVDPFNETQVRQDYQPFLEACLERNVPIICANPDIFAPNGKHEDGSTKFLICPGYVGQMYEEMGGQVLYFGKPFKSIYDYLVQKIAASSDDSSSRRIICVGDNVATDVKGATEAGLDVVMVMGGVHWEELKQAKDDQQRMIIVEELCRVNDCKTPTYLMPLLKY
ncbi:HAD-like domain-containing protein [Gilbertella persicaria]|uniref:HAD-like domain-containing protein n=1 Tax=Gilbertella persicaria TaxID=101096 RepID=UPI00221ED934|nr:HAD-like domain-containing protein [Gilbertella persicaria]KAI8078103.1 HAD-like domain-containing protein [Gilbertella persicaria]